MPPTFFRTAVIETMEPGIVPGPITAARLRSCRTCLSMVLSCCRGVWQPRCNASDLHCDAVLVIVVNVTTADEPGCSTQRATGLGGVTGDRELNDFICVPAAFVGGVPLTRAMNPWVTPEAST